MSARACTAVGAALALFALLPVPASALPDQAHQNEEIFFDDFSGQKLDRSKWTVEVTGENFQTVNNEQQAYVDSPETIYVEPNAEGAENGALALHPRFEAGHQAPDGNSYDFVSGRIKTQDKVEFTYGSYSARIKLPEGATGSGLWPAFWSLGANYDEVGWPDCGEVDVMEHVGEPWTSVAMHGPEYNGETPINGEQKFEGKDPAAWHVYRVDWTPEGFTWYVDDTEIYSITKQEFEQNGWTWVFDSDQFMTLNFALGGTYPQGVNGVTEPYFGLPQESVDKVKSGSSRLLVDWVKVERN